MSKEQDFKERFIVVLKDLQANGSKDRQAMWLLGGLAWEIAQHLQQPNWTKAKAVMSTTVYDDLLAAFQERGNAFHQAGDTRRAYAIQALALSLIARTQRDDASMAAGDDLLNGVIDLAISVYRLSPSRAPDPA